MADPGSPTPRAELEARIVRRARDDAAFADWLVRDPRAAVSDELGVELPEGLTVTVVQERPDAMCIVLPVDLSGLGPDAVWAMTGRPPA
jgi:hypothetical protein